ncbi:hypothetical protein KIW84_031258 [Lathyrus oleraceus]|uniref:Uncharacterized protein n=1 Tax=Pisum sativum TaxID=3888 RepID=A0A9D4XUU9_PEA|nr:hypothetical protein KIW84_031258 [Pisum sativum]
MCFGSSYTNCSNDGFRHKCFPKSAHQRRRCTGEGIKAKVVVAYAKKLRKKFSSYLEEVPYVVDFEVHMSYGVSRKVGDKTILVENRRLVNACNAKISYATEKYIFENENMARTCVLVSINGKIAGAFSVFDLVKLWIKQCYIKMPMIEGLSMANLMSIAIKDTLRMI